MENLNNLTLQKFIDNLIKNLKEENEIRKSKTRLQELDIPFIISTLYQDFEENVDNYKEFVNDLNYYYDYNIDVFESQNEWNGIIDIAISLVRYTDDKYDNYDYPEYNYKIEFEMESRDWGYCECTPDMKDYREDKKCCGHGCDAAFCEFNLYKVNKIIHGVWKGDEHDYWDFEDNFYMSDEELFLDKQKKEREAEIKMLKENIDKYNKRLYELLEPELLGGEK